MNKNVKITALLVAASMLTASLSACTGNTQGGKESADSGKNGLR